MKKFFLVSFVLLVLFGAGCSATKKPQEPLGPADQELARMTDKERELALQQMLKDYPMLELSSLEREGEAQTVREMVKDEKNIIRVAEFSSRAHPAQGSARMVKKDTRYALVISEDFAVDPGPYLRFVFTGRSDPQTSAEMQVQGSLEVGLVKSAIGGQVYDLPGNFDPWRYQSLVVYCKQFKIIFASGQFK